ncbi:MAG: hypothetical protein WEC00_03290 [Dongiaceae bacterium]
MLSDSERAFWRHAVEQERRQIDLRRAERETAGRVIFLPGR